MIRFLASPVFLAILSLTALTAAAQTPTQTTSSPASAQIFVAPQAKRYPMVGVLPARLENAQASDHWTALSLYESLTTTVWRIRDLRPMTRSPVGWVLQRRCPTLSDACIATLTEKQHVEAAIELYAEGVITPIVTRTGSNYRLKLLYLDASGKTIEQNELAWKPGDLGDAQNLLNQLITKVRDKGALPALTSQSAHPPKRIEFNEAASRLYSDCIRLEWAQEQKGISTPEESLTTSRARNALLKKANELDPDYYGAWNALGFSYTDLEQNDLAEQAFKKALELEPGHIAPRAGLALVAMNRKQFQDAARIYQAAFLDAPGLAEMGGLLLSALNTRDAFSDEQRRVFVASFGKYLTAQRPQSVWPLELALGYSASNVDDNVLAESYARRVISALQQVHKPAELKLINFWPISNELLARSLYDQDKEIDVPEYLLVAIAEFEIAAKRDPKVFNERLARLYETQADTFETLKNYSESLDYYDKAIGLFTLLDGENTIKAVTLQRGMARVLNKQKRFKEAEEKIRPLWTRIEKSNEIKGIDKIRTLAVLNSSLENQKRHNENLPLLEIRRNLADAETEKKELASALRDLGDAQFALSRDAAPLKTYQELLALRRTLKIEEGATDAFLRERITRIHGNLKQTAEGMITLKKALDTRRAIYASASSDGAKLDGRIALANSLQYLSNFWRDQLRPKESIPLLEESVALRRNGSSGANETLADVIDDLAKALYEIDSNTLALPLANEALAIRTKLYGADDARTLTAREKRADILNDSEKIADAQSEYFDILRARERLNGKSSAQYVNAMRDVIGALRNTGEYSRALEYAQEAVVISTKLSGPTSRATLDAKASLASVLEPLGRYAEVVSLRREFLLQTIQQYGLQTLVTANAQRGLASIYASMGSDEEAFNLRQQSLKTRQALLAQDATDIGQAHLEVGYSLSNLGKGKEARESYAKALTIIERNYGADSLRATKVLAALSNLAFIESEYDTALTYLLKVRAIESKILPATHPEVATSMNNLATIYTNTKRAQQAVPLLVQASLIAEAQGNLRSASNYLGNLTYLYLRQDQRPAAILFGKRAINYLQQIRTQSLDTDKELQRSLVSSNTNLYRVVADALAKEGRIAEAQEVLAMLKEDEYFSFIRRDSNEKPTSTLARLTAAEAPWLKRYQELGGSITQLASELAKLRDSNQGASTRAKQLEADLAIANEGFERITSELLKSVSDQKARQLTSKNIEAQSGLQETLGQLGEGGEQVALAQYVVLPDRIGIFVTTAQIQVAREALIASSDLNKLVSDFREALMNPKLDPRPAAQRLHQLLIAPIAEDLAGAKVTTLMLAPDGSLRYLPFAALYDGERYLVEKTNLALFNAAASDKLKDKPNPNTKVWGLGLTKEKPGFSALAGVKRELEAIIGQSGIKGEVHLDEAFTEERLQAGLAQKFPVLHIASHFKFAAGTEADSFLLMGDGSKLSLQDVRRRYRFAGVDLLTLSACETAFGGGEDANGREVEGFATLAQSRGARAVLATLWPVADESTSRMMQTMYSNREKQKLTKAAAVRQSQLALLTGNVLGSDGKTPVVGPEVWRGAQRNPLSSSTQQQPLFVLDAKKPFAHPYYWAPFILMGNWL